MKIKLLSIIGIGTFTVMSGVVLASNHKDVNFVNTAKSMYTPNDISYSCLRQVSKIGTLLDGVNVTFVAERGGHDIASNTTLNGSNYLEASQVNIEDGTFAHDNLFTLKKSNSVYRFVSGSKYLSYNKAYNADFFLYDEPYLTHSDWNITITDGLATLENVYNHKYINPGSSSDVFYFDNSCSLRLFVDSNSALESWIATYLYMDEDVSGQWIDYFEPAKEALLAMDDYVKANLYSNTDYKAAKDRYESWASYHKEEPYKE